MRLGSERKMGKGPGELNHYFYQPKGLAAVIAPWNFPLAISCGMSSAALVAGNCVLYKPSGLSAVVGFTLAEVFKEGLIISSSSWTPSRSRRIPCDEALLLSVRKTIGYKGCVIQDLGRSLRPTLPCL